MGASNHAGSQAAINASYSITQNEGDYADTEQS